MTIELVGRVPARTPVEDEHEPDPGRLAVRTPLGTSAASTCSSYARRVSRPYAAAVARHLDTESPTLTERGVTRMRRGTGTDPGSP